MKNKIMPKQFLQLFSDPAPALRVKFDASDADEKAKIIPVQHRLGLANETSRKYLDSIGSSVGLRKFREFYQKHNGAELCRTHDARCGQERPLLEFKPAESIVAFSKRYMSNGDLGWTIDLNKSKVLYRSSASWFAFAQIDGGPACLTIFLDGENAGCVYYVTPQPSFNILRPIAKGFQPLLNRITKDLPAFMRLIRSTVSIRGIDGHNYGFVPVEYVANINESATET